MLYKSVLQSILSFGSMDTVGDMHAQDQNSARSRQPVKVIRVDQVSVTQLYNKLIFFLKKIEQILKVLILSRRFSGEVTGRFSVCSRKIEPPGAAGHLCLHHRLHNKRLSSALLAASQHIYVQLLHVFTCLFFQSLLLSEVVSSE